MAVNVKLGVDLGGFTSGIKEGQQILKGLNAEMKATEAEFAATGNAEQLLANKTKTLNSQLQVQKGIADQAAQALKAMESAGIAPTDAAYQKMYATMMNATAGMNQAQAALNELGTSATEAANGAGSLKDGLEGIGKKISLKQVIDGIGSITDTLERGAKAAARIGKAIMTETLGAANWADELTTTAQAYGISTDELQRMEKTAQIIDTSVDDILKARQRLGKNGSAVNELFGIETEGRSIEDVFWETGEAIMAMGDAFEQEEAAQKIFGKSWRDLVPLFTAGREEYERVNSTWKTVSDEQLESLTNLDDKYQALKSDLETLKMEALSELAEPMGNLMQALSDLIGSEEGQEAINSAIGIVKDTLNWIAENKETVIAALEGIGAAFVGLKVSETVLRFVELVSGLKGLFGGGGVIGAGGASAGLGAVLKTGLATAGGASALVPLGMLGAGLLPAEIVMNQTRQKWASDYARRTSAAGSAGENEYFIRTAAEALGTNGQVDFGTVESLLMGLASRKNQQKADLYNALSGSTTAGSSTWDVLNAFWGGAEMDQSTVNELVQNITDAFANSGAKANVPVDVTVPDNAAEQISAQIGTVPVQVALGGILFGSMGQGFANGLPYVPNDGLYLLHRGERVMTAREVSSRSYNSNLYVESIYMNNGMDANGLASAMAAAQRRTMSGYGS